MSAPISKQPPFSEEAEKGVLSSMLQGGANVIEDCRALLRSEAFFVPQHQQLFNLIIAAHNGKMALDLVTFTQELRDAGLLDEIGGAAGVTSVFNFVPSAVNVDYYLQIVREKWTAREIISRCTEGVRKAYDESSDVNTVLEEIQSNIIEIGQISKTTEAIQHIAGFVEGAVAEIKATYHSRGKTIGLPTGFYDLDRMTGGLQAPLTYYFAGRPAMGKSSIMVELAEHLAIENTTTGKNVGIFSVEMTGRQLAKRILCSRAEINLQRLRDGFLAKETLPRLEEEASRVVKSSIWIDDTGALSIFEFRARARRMVTKFGVKLIIIDYIQRMHSTSKRAQNNREQEIMEIAKGISETAKELHIPIVILAQLNRKNEERADKVPQLSDLRESGSMEQEARFVGLLHRPVYYCVNDSAKARKAEAMQMSTDEFESYTELIIAKQNEGPVGTIRLRFVKQFARFENVTSDLYSNRAEDRQAVNFQGEKG